MPSLLSTVVNRFTSSDKSQDASPKHSVVAEKRKAPPPESPENVRQRTKVILSFWAVALLIGVPLWWTTTSIYRAPLPLAEMQNWSEGKECKAEFPLLVDVEASSVVDPFNLLKTVQHALDDANDFAIHRPHHLRLRLAPQVPTSSVVHQEASSASTNADKGTNSDTEDVENVACILRLIQVDASTPMQYLVQPSSRVVEIRYSSLNNLAQFIAETLEEIFWQEQRLIEHLLLPHNGMQSAVANSPATASGPNGDGSTPRKNRALQAIARQGQGQAPQNLMDEADISRRMSRVIRYAANYHLTFSLFTATALPASWDIEDALVSYMSPLLSALSSISNFTVSSQVQYYASMSQSVIPQWDEEKKAWTLKQEELSSFINSAEWPLASMSDDPTINFILYIPHPQYQPLFIPNSSYGDSFLLPQWGGVTILNPGLVSTNSKDDANSSISDNSNTMIDHLTTVNLQTALDRFAAQLLALLGAPPHPASLPIRLDSLTRQRSAEVLVSASSTLGSLFRVTSNLSSISIPTAVSDSVQETLSHLRYACDALSRGKFKRALEMGRIAQEEAEKAFFERAMVAQVYFPEEHKIAVYLPLLGPVGVPLVMGLLREGVRWVKARRERNDVVR